MKHKLQCDHHLKILEFILSQIVIHLFSKNKMYSL